MTLKIVLTERDYKIYMERLGWEQMRDLIISIHSSKLDMPEGTEWIFVVEKKVAQVIDMKTGAIISANS